MNLYVEKINAYLEENKPEDVDSLVEVLYYCFCLQHDLQTEQIRSGFQEIEKIIGKLSIEENDRISDITCCLCERYQHEAFREGLLIGFQLYRELYGSRIKD